MARDRGGRVSRDARVAGLRVRIDQWRRTRATRAMPEELWSRAVALARTHGVYAVARVLGLNYGTLRSRVGAGRQGAGEGEPNTPAFVEVPVVAGAGTAPSVVELWRGDGARMTIRVAHELDVAELSAAFVGRRR